MHILFLRSVLTLAHTAAMTKAILASFRTNASACGWIPRSRIVLGYFLTKVDV